MPKATASCQQVGGGTAAAVSLAGIIGWVGLVVPHVARLLAGPCNARVVPLSAGLGAIFLLPAMAYWLNVGAAEAKARIKRLQRQPRHAHAAGSAGGISHAGGMLKPEPQSSVNGKV